MKKQSADLSLGEALDLACQFAMAGNHDSAINLCRGVIIHEPDNFEAVERLGSSLFEKGDLHEAMFWFWRGRKIARRHPLALTNYALCLSQLGHPAEGLPDLERAAALVEKDKGTSPAVKALVYNNLGNTLMRLDRFAEALAALDKGISANPADPFPHYNRGIALLRLNRHQEAMAALDYSLANRPPQGAIDSPSRLNDADARYNRGMARLLLGDLKGGFADYEWRLLTTENSQPNFGLKEEKKWTGAQDIAGKRLLVYCEQGLGDTVQFLRFVPELVARGAKVSMICHAQTKPLAELIDGVQVPEPGAKIQFDLWVALMSLPLCLGVETEAQIPPPWAMPLDPERVEKWRRPVKSPGRFNVGVAWAGNFMHKNDAHRSIPLATFAKLFEASGCNFVSLQQMRPIDTEAWPLIEQRYGGLTSLRALWLDDFRDTAAVISHLDLVVTADTAVAHVAATLGVPTWILIPKFSTDWRWMLQRTDSPWYPSVRLIRQEKIGDWETPLARIKAELARAGEASRVA